MVHIWPYMAIYGHLWSIYGPYMVHIWPYMAIYGHIWFIYGHIWPDMAIYGHIWPYMARYGHIWPIYGHIYSIIGRQPRMANLPTIGDCLALTRDLEHSKALVKAHLFRKVSHQIQHFLNIIFDRNGQTETPPPNHCTPPPHLICMGGEGLPWNKTVT